MAEERHHNILSRKERAYEARIADLERQVSDQHADVESAKAAASKLMGQNRSFAASDSDIVMWFDTRAKAWYEWAKDAAYPNVQHFKDLSQAEAEEVKPLLSQFIAFRDGDFPMDLLDSKPNRIVYVLLHGILANFIASEIFKRPLWILEALQIARTVRLSEPTMTTSMTRLHEFLLDSK